MRKKGPGDVVVAVVALVVFSALLVSSFKRNRASVSVFIASLVGVYVSVFALVYVVSMKSRPTHRRLSGGCRGGRCVGDNNPKAAPSVQHHIEVPLVSGGSDVQMTAGLPHAQVKCPPGFVLVGGECRRSLCPVNRQHFIGVEEESLVACDLARSTGSSCAKPPTTEALRTACLEDVFWGGCAAGTDSRAFIGDMMCASSVSPDATRLNVVQRTALNGRGATGSVVPRMTFFVSHVDFGARLKVSADRVSMTVVLRAPTGHAHRKTFLVNSSWDGAAPYIITADFPEVVPGDHLQLLVLLHSDSGMVLAYNDPPIPIVSAEFPGMTERPSALSVALDLNAAVQAQSLFVPDDQVEWRKPIHGLLLVKRKDVSDELTIIGALMVDMNKKTGLYVATTTGHVALDNASFANTAFSLRTTKGTTTLLFGSYGPVVMGQSVTWKDAVHRSELSVVRVTW